MKVLHLTILLFLVFLVQARKHQSTLKSPNYFKKGDDHCHARPIGESMPTQEDVDELFGQMNAVYKLIDFRRYASVALALSCAASQYANQQINDRKLIAYIDTKRDMLPMYLTDIVPNLTWKVVYLFQFRSSITHMMCGTQGQGLTTEHCIRACICQTLDTRPPNQC